MRACIALIFCFFALPAYASDLEQAVVKALQTHPGIAAAREGVEAEREQIRSERSALFPRVSLSATGGRIYGDNSTSRGLSVTRGAGYSNLWEGSASLNQTLFDWSATGQRINRAEALEDRARFSLEDRMEATAYRAVQAYIALVAAREAMQLMRMQKNQLTEMRTRIAISVRDGGGDDSELARADDLILLADNGLANARAREATAIANYVEAVGVEPPTSMSLPDDPQASLPNDVMAAITKAVNTHPQIAAIDKQAQSFIHEAKAEGAAALPRLEGNLSYLKRDQRDVIGGEATDARATLNLNWDIETGLGPVHRKNRAEALSAQARAEREATRAALERDIRTAWAGYELAVRQIAIQSRRVEIAMALMATYENQFEAAQRSLLDIMQVTAQLYEARLSRMDAFYGRVDAAYTVLAAMGHLRRTVMTGE